MHVAQPPGSTDLYVVEARGTVQLVRDGVRASAPFLDIATDRIGTAPTDERGLLSIAFHPDYSTNGRAFIGYTPTTRGNQNRVAEIRRRVDDPQRAEFVRDILVIDDPYRNHNGGLVMFGPDGMLYVATGDGGGANDPDETGQDLTTLMGKILRIDVDAAPVAPLLYAIPSDNPFVTEGGGARAEIWAYGVRNPWRFSFDRLTDEFWMADVGQDTYEEVNVVAFAAGGGVNYGWSAFEGDHPFLPSGVSLRPGSTHHTPVLEYTHGLGQSIAGGYVYRGSAIPALQGVYLYADSAEPWVRGVRVCDGEITAGPTEITGIDISGGGYGLVSFGEDNAGELYVVLLSGTVARIVAAP